ncbi:MAG: SDR family oxidoreductase [Acidimicrobiales bacterium]|nr:SDR family oxidoreductase [Acidimicrobiales bacterium]RZV47235.1 MAG: SDR family oxidoreductase [Acidimicrobiales bacterium]
MPAANFARLDQRVAIVTGGASGIGRAIVDALADAGAKLAIVDLREVPSSELPADSISLIADVSDVTSVENAYDAALDHFGRLDIVVNNAGVLDKTAVTKITPEDFHRVLSINVGGVVWGTQAAATRLGAGGCVINMASIAARVALPMDSLYAASKAAVVAFTENAAIELADSGIRINAVCPGFIDTPMNQEAADGGEEDIAKTATPLRRLGQPTEVAALVRFLASDDAAFITGAAYDVDGGTSRGISLGAIEAMT